MSAATLAMLLAPAAVAAEPVQELFLGETSEISRVGEVQVSAGVTSIGRKLAFPVEAEVGLLEHLELTTELGQSAALHLGASAAGLSTYIGAEWSASDDRMKPAWAAVAALGISRDRLAVHVSGEVDARGVGVAAGLSLALGSLSPIVELSLGDDGGALATGAAWRLFDDVELGLAGSIDRERTMSVLLHVVTELDLLPGGRNR